MIHWTNRIEYHASCEEFTQTTTATQKKELKNQKYRCSQAHCGIPD
jgi:hypothetical protein